MDRYLEICMEILERGVIRSNRTGVDTLAISGTMFQHDMSKGFPLLTTKKVPYKNIKSELEFFIKGYTDKKWLQDRGNHIWDDWCNPKIIHYGHGEKNREAMREERDLGPIYGFQWRHFGGTYNGFDGNHEGEGVDQLKNLVDKLKNDPTDRRMVVSAWNPTVLNQQALPPCHYGFQVNTIGDKLNLSWNQRSVDVPLGLPFNIASYGTLLHLLSKESNLKEGILTGFLMDTHIYVNQIEGIKEQISRIPKNLPKISTEKFTDIFNWNYTDTNLEGYESHPPIKFPISV